MDGFVTLWTKNLIFEDGGKACVCVRGTFSKKNIPATLGERKKNRAEFNGKKKSCNQSAQLKKFQN